MGVLQLYVWHTNEFDQVVVRARARLVANGFLQRAEGVDYLEAFTPCSCVARFRLLNSVACELGFESLSF